MERQGASKLSESGTLQSPQPGAEEVRPSPGSQEELDALPKSYGRTTLVVMPVDPYLVHAYWEVAPKDLENVKRLWDPQVQPALRFYDVTGIAFDGTNAQRCFDVDVQLGAENWYVHLGSPAKSFVADLGLRRGDGSFLALVRSNPAHTPAAEPSMNVDVQHRPVPVGSKVQEMGAVELPAREPDVGRMPRGPRPLPVVDMARTVWKKLAQIYQNLGREEPDYAPKPATEGSGARPATAQQGKYSASAAGTGASTQTTGAHLAAGSPASEPEVAIAPDKVAHQEEGRTPDGQRPPGVIDMARTVWKTLAQLYQHLLGEEPGYGPRPAAESASARPNIGAPQPGEDSASATGVSTQTTGTRVVDLTQMNEDSFISGVSSR